MAGKNTLLTRNKMRAIANLKSKKIGSKGLDEIKATSKLATTRSNELFRLLIASAAEKVKLASFFFEDLPKRLGKVGELTKLRPQDFNFDSWKEGAEYLKNKLTTLHLNDANIKEFTEGMKGRKWWFMGEILWEPYIKYGPMRKFLNDTAQDACHIINERIRKDQSYRMILISENKLIPVTQPFGNLSAGVEFFLDDKKFLDFGHTAFSKQGYFIVPTPTEIKQLAASEAVATQFSEFIPRLSRAKKLIVRFEESDYTKLKNAQKQSGSAILKLEEVKVDGRTLIQAEINPSKLVFDSNAKNQLVVRPARKAWGIVKAASKSPNIEINIAASTIGAATKGKDFDKGFNYWKYDVDISRDPFEKVYEAVLLGK